MTRNEIENTYANAFGNITEPGKYEGEPIWAPYFHGVTMDGCTEELSFMEDGRGEYVALVEINDDDRKEFPELGNAVYIMVRETEQGFVTVDELTKAEADQYRAAYAEE